MNSLILNSPGLPLSLISDAHEWNAFVAREGGHLLQAYEWGELKSRFGWRAERWARTETGDITAGAQVLFRRILPGFEVAYVPRGPVRADETFLLGLREQIDRKGAFLFKLEPDWLEGDARETWLQTAGWKRSNETIQPRATIRLDLTLDLDVLLARMKPKWRYNIRLAEKKGVKVREGNAADMIQFYSLMQTTADRDRFPVHGDGYYRAAFELLVGRDKAHLFVAEYEGQALAMIFVTMVGHEAIYLYGASSNEHRNVMPNHALHWAAICKAKERGCRQYDLWGVPEGLTEGNVQLPGSLYQFKQGFGGAVVSYSGAFDYVRNAAQYAIYRAARRIRRSGLT